MSFFRVDRASVRHIGTEEAFAGLGLSKRAVASLIRAGVLSPRALAQAPWTDEEARARYSRLCDAEVEGEVLEHPSVAAFYAELTAEHPEIDDIPEGRVDDTEYCPWSVAMDRSDGHVIMACVWSRAEYVGQLVRHLARKHGLAIFDPQQGRVSYPDSSDEPEPPSANEGP